MTTIPFSMYIKHGKLLTYGVEVQVVVYLTVVTLIIVSGVWFGMKVDRLLSRLQGEAGNNRI
jgi:hypothetical protein